MTPKAKFPWFCVPPFLIFTGWVNDNIIPIIGRSLAINIVNEFTAFDFFSKWILCGVAASIMANRRFRDTAKLQRGWLGLWLTLWAMLLFEFSARLYELFGWMGGLGHYLYPRCFDCSYSDNMTALALWAARPMFAFGTVYILIAFIQGVFKGTRSMWPRRC